MTALDAPGSSTRTPETPPVTAPQSEPLGSRLKRRVRTEAQKKAQAERKKALWLARADDRMNAEKVSILERYLELKRAMAKVGLKIGTIKDIETDLDDPVKRFEVLKARVGRWDALWSITRRKRETRGKIIFGGVILAALADLDPNDVEAERHRAWLFKQVNERVLRVRDRGVLRELLTDDNGQPPPIPFRQGGPIDEPIEDALAALGEGLSAFEQRAYGGGQYDHDSGEEADLTGFLEP